MDSTGLEFGPSANGKSRLMMLEQGSDGLDIEPVRELNEGNYQFCYYFVNGDLGKESPEKPLI